MSTDWRTRLTEVLEPVLRQADPRPALSSYHDMPYAIFQYSPQEELAVRREVRLLRTRLEQGGKRVHPISLADCLREAIETAGESFESLAAAERNVGLEATILTVFGILSEVCPLDGVVARRMPPDADPERDLVFIQRVGALFPVYRTSAILEQLKGRVPAPTVLFYPGELVGGTGLSFMGVLDADNNYRPKIF